MVDLSRMLLAAGDPTVNTAGGAVAGPDAAAMPCAGGSDSDSSCTSTIDVTALRVLAISIILLCGAVGILAPEAMRRHGVNKDHNVFFLGKAFGAGVIIATGLMHLFPDAVTAFNNPNLHWKGYQWAGAIATVTVIFIQAFEVMVGKIVEVKIRKRASETTLNKERASDDKDPQDVEQQKVASASAHAFTMNGSMHSHLVGDQDKVQDQDNIVSEEDIHHETVALVLEAGIAMHSILIGVALGVQKTACMMVPYVIALVFHQMFEGFALGTCLVEAQYNIRSYITMAVLFSGMTPVGVGIGIAIQDTYNENSPAALAVNGVFDAVSAGILIYMGIVDILADDFRSPRFKSSRSLQVWSYIAVLLGAGIMLYVGVWA